MIIFAVDSATRACSAALVRDGISLAESGLDMGLTHSQTLMPLCDDVFRRAGISPADVDYFAVTCGPGSFTGLRIGMGTIKGMAFAAQKPCVAVPTLEALAYNVVPTERTVIPVLDARRDRVYCAAFSAERAVTRLCEDSVDEINALGNRLTERKLLFVGDAAEICYNTLKDRVDCIVPPACHQLPRAACVAMAAISYISQGRAVPAAQLVPDYIQLPQAERERRQREGEYDCDCK